MKLYDKTGREMMDGDLFRVFHFTDSRTRRKRYLYFILQYTPQFGVKWWGVDIRGGFAKHHWPVYEEDAMWCEIMNSPSIADHDGGFGDFVDRPINREILKERRSNERK